MNANEFRIGNYVYGIEKGFQETAMEISSLHSDDTFRLKIGNSSIGCYSCKRIKPVRLSIEWLIKFGFEKHGEWFILDDSKMPANMSINISLIHKKTIIGSNEGYEIQNIKYVHQLQNLYFALTGEELKIK